MNIETLWSPFLDVKIFNLIPIVNLIHYFVVDKIHFQFINFFLFLAHNIFFWHSLAIDNVENYTTFAF